MRSHLGKFPSTSTEDLEGNLENVTKFGYQAIECCIKIFFEERSFQKLFDV